MEIDWGILSGGILVGIALSPFHVMGRVFTEVTVLNFLRDVTPQVILTRSREVPGFGVVYWGLTPQQQPGCSWDFPSICGTNQYNDLVEHNPPCV